MKRAHLIPLVALSLVLGACGVAPTASAPFAQPGSRAAEAPPAPLGAVCGEAAPTDPRAAACEALRSYGEAYAEWKAAADDETRQAAEAQMVLTVYLGLREVRIRATRASDGEAIVALADRAIRAHDELYAKMKKAATPADEAARLAALLTSGQTALGRIRSHPRR